MMKANLVSEKLQNFERGQDPKEAMGIGVKKRFFEYFPTCPSRENSEIDYELWQNIKRIINKTTTEVTFDYKITKGKLYNKSIPTKNYFMTIKLPVNEMNIFFFRYLQIIIDAHTPKKLYHFVLDKDNEVTYYIPDQINKI
jgi:hypothetical protein